MAKSLRSKVKRSFRSKKRQSGIYAATEAARLHRLNAKLMSLASEDHGGDTTTQEHEEVQEQDPDQLDSPGVDNTSPVSAHTDNHRMDLDTKTTTPSIVEAKRISTHGPREQWRISRGLDAKGRRKGTHNRKAGPKRRP